VGDRARHAADAQAALFRTFREARDAGDVELMAEAALKLPSGQRFGTHPGQVPALVHEAYAAAAESASRSGLAAALARGPSAKARRAARTFLSEQSLIESG